KRPSDEVRGNSRRMALATSPAPITCIGRLRPSFATSSGGNSPSSLADPAAIIIPATKTCNTQPAISFQFQSDFIVQLLSRAIVELTGDLGHTVGLIEKRLRLFRGGRMGILVNNVAAKLRGVGGLTRVRQEHREFQLARSPFFRRKIDGR